MREEEPAIRLPCAACAPSQVFRASSVTHAASATDDAAKSQRLNQSSKQPSNCDNYDENPERGALLCVGVLQVFRRGQLLYSRIRTACCHVGDTSDAPSPVTELTNSS